MPEVYQTNHIFIASDRFDSMVMSGSIAHSMIPGVNPRPPEDIWLPNFPWDKYYVRTLGVAFDGAQNIWVTIDSMHGVAILSPLTLFKTIIWGVIEPYGVAIDKDGNGWVTSRTTGKIYKFAPRALKAYEKRNAYSVGNGPTGVACDRFNNVWVANSLSNSVTKLATDGSLIGRFRVPKMPRGIAVDALGNAWVATNGAGVVKVAQGGSIEGILGPGLRLFWIALDTRGNVWATEPHTNRVHKFSPNSAHFDSFPVGRGPTGISADSFGNVWVTNTMDNSITKMAGNGTILGTFPLPTTRGPYNLGDATGFAYRRYVLGEQ